MVKKKKACYIIATDVLQEYISNRKDDLGKIIYLVSKKKDVVLVTTARALITAIRKCNTLNPDRLKEIVTCVDINIVHLTDKMLERI